MACVVLIVGHSWTCVVSWSATFRPCPAVALPVMDDDFTARWCQWGGIEVELSIDECVGGYFWLEPGSLEKVEGLNGLWDE